MVSSFSNPGFPPVHAHPTRLPAMDARISAAIDSFEASVRAAFHDAWDSALVAADLAVRRALAPLCRDLALIAAGKSNPVLMFSADGASHDLGHPKLHGDGNQPRISLPVTVHSVPPLFSSSPLLREIAAPSVKPQSNSNASMATHTNNSKPFLSNQEAPTSVHDLGLTLSHKGAKASGPFQWLLHDASDNINIKGYGDHMSVKLQILRLCKQPSMNTNTTKRRHEVLRSLIYNFKNRKAMWHWFLHSSLACYTDGKVVMNDAYLNEINGWVGMFEVGKFVMVMNAKKVFDEMPKRECENIIDLQAGFSVLFPSNLDFRSVWDPGDPLAPAVKLMLYLQCKEGKRMGKKQSCFCSRQCGGDWHHAAMPSLVSWVVARRVGTWKPPHAYQYNLHNDKREKHKDNLFEVQRLLHLTTRQMLKPFWNASTIADYIMEIEFLWEKDIKVALWGGNTTSLIFSAFESWIVVEHTKGSFKQQWLSLTFSKVTLEAIMAKAGSQWYAPYQKTQFSILKAPGNLFDRMSPLFHNKVVCSQFFITRGGFWNGWDPGGRLVNILRMILCSKHQENHCDNYSQFFIPQLDFINHVVHFSGLLQVLQYENATVIREIVFDTSGGRLSFIRSLLRSQNTLEVLYLRNVAGLNMYHKTREWHDDVFWKIKRLNEKGVVSVMNDTEGQTNYEGFSGYIRKGDELVIDGVMAHFEVLEKLESDMVEILGLLNSFKSLRWMRQLQTTEFKLTDQDNETYNRPPSSVNLFVCGWGEVDCIEVCDIREWPPTSPLDHKSWIVVLLLEESYLALGQAYKEEGQLHQALQVVEFACSVYGSMPQHLEDTKIISSMSSCFSSPTKFSCTIKKTTSSNSDFSLETIAVCTLTKLVLKLEEIQPSKVVANKATTHASLIMASMLQLSQSLVLPHLIDDDSQDRIVLCIELLCHKGEVRKILLESFRQSIVKMLADKQLWETKESKAKTHILIAPPHDLIDFYHLKGRQGMSQLSWKVRSKMISNVLLGNSQRLTIRNTSSAVFFSFSDKLKLVELIVGTIRPVAPFTGDKQAIEKYNQFFNLTLRTRLFLRGRQCYELRI